MPIPVGLVHVHVYKSKCGSCLFIQIKHQFTQIKILSATCNLSASCMMSNSKVQLYCSKRLYCVNIIINQSMQCSHLITNLILIENSQQIPCKACTDETKIRKAQSSVARIAQLQASYQSTAATPPSHSFEWHCWSFLQEADMAFVMKRAARAALNVRQQAVRCMSTPAPNRNPDIPQTKVRVFSPPEKNAYIILFVTRRKCAS